jgi:hypothetical protein
MIKRRQKRYQRRHELMCFKIMFWGEAVLVSPSYEIDIHPLHHYQFGMSLFFTNVADFRYLEFQNADSSRVNIQKPWLRPTSETSTNDRNIKTPHWTRLHLIISGGLLELLRFLSAPPNDNGFYQPHNFKYGTSDEAFSYSDRTFFC